MATKISLDITETDIRVLQLKGNKIAKFASQAVPEGLIKDGVITDSHSTAVIIDNLFKETKLSRSKVVCTLTGLPFIYRTLTMPIVSQKLLVEAVEREARRELAISESDMHLIWTEIETREEARETDYFIMAVPRTSLTPLLETLEIAGIKPYLIDITPMAIARAAGMKDAILVSMEKHYFDMVIVTNGLVRVIHSLTPNAYPDDTMGIARDFSDGLSKAIKFYNLDYSEPIAEDTPIVLTGELSVNEGIQRLIQENTGRPVSLLGTTLTIPEEFNPGMFAALIGLSFKGQRPAGAAPEFHDIDINLLFIAKKPAAFQFKPIYAISAAIVILLAFMVYKTYQMKIEEDNRVEMLQQQSTAISADLKEATGVNKDITANVDKQTNDLKLADETLAAIRGKNQFVSGLRTDFSSRVITIIGDLPEDSDYVSINMNPNKINVEGTAIDLYDIIEYTRTLEINRYFIQARVDGIREFDEEYGYYPFELEILNEISVNFIE